MRIRTAAAMMAAGVIIGLATGITRADAQTAGDIYTPAGATGCTGNNVIQDAPYSCSGARDFRQGQVRWTIRVDFSVDAAGNGTAVYTLSRPGPVQTLPQDVPIRVRSHSGISSLPGPLVDDVSGVIPAGSTTATLRFRVVCGQIDVKAVFTDEGNGNGRIMGPFVCTAPTDTTTPTTAPTSVGTVPDSAPVTGPTSTVGPAVSVSAQVRGNIPATGSNAPLLLALSAALVVAGVVLVTRGRDSQPTP